MPRTLTRNIRGWEIDMNLRYNADGTCNCKPLGGGCFFTHPYDDSKPCDCKCHMSTHNTREWEKEFDKQFPTLSVSTKCAEKLGYDLVHRTKEVKSFIHQELQKAREEERERCLGIFKSMLANEGSSGKMYNEFKKKVNN